MAMDSSSISRAARVLDRLPRWLGWPARGAIFLAVLTLIAGGVVWMVYSSLARGYDLKKLGEMPERSIVYDMRGVEIGKLHGENRVSIPLAQVSTHFIEALLAREDDRFYSHGGVDYRGLVRALLRDIKDREFTQGASTITMQLARNSFSMRGKSLHRKLLEIAVARRIESKFSKDEILELYVNRIFFGTGLYGVERASQSYFGKSASALTLDEAAMLAAIIRGPNRFSPFRAYDVALSGKAMVLDRMVIKGRADPAAASAAKLVKTKVLPEPQVSSQETYALDAVRRSLDQVLDAEDEEDGGLRIFTTLDLELQAAAERALEDRLSAVEKTKGYPHITRAQWRERVAQGTASGPPEYVEGAVVAIDNTSGATLVVVGGRSLEESAFNRALLATRQVGSTFKPFVYTAAVQAGMLPTTLVDDGPIDIDGWQPKNSDGTFGGLLPAEIGLAKSRNTMTIRVGVRAGLEHVMELVERVGLGKDPKPTPQLFIGNHDTTLHKLTSAFTCFPNAGQRFRPFLIERIENKEGDVIFRNAPQSYPVMAPGAAWCVTKMMEKVLSPAGTAASARAQGYKFARRWEDWHHR